MVFSLLAKLDYLHIKYTVFRTMIELIDIVKKYGDHTALDDISLTINDGEVVGLLGPNGAGKTTLMRIITGFLFPDSGEVRINDQTYSRAELLLKRELGYMPESNALYKDMLVSEFLHYTLSLHQINGSLKKERVSKAVEITDLKSVYNKPISSLSKGFKQRVGIANALITDPNVVILDEPTEGLDPNQRVEIRNVIKELGKERTVIISTHVMQEVEAMCDRIVILNQGQIVSDGSKQEIVKQVKGSAIFSIGVNHEAVDNIAKNLEKIKEVTNVEIGEKHQHFTKIKVTAPADYKFQSEFTKQLHKSKATLYYFAQEGDSLEELFQQLTYKDKESKPITKKTKPHESNNKKK